MTVLAVRAGAEMRQVVVATRRFPRQGALYAVGQEVNGRRPVRPATPDNPTPDLGDWLRPPTYHEADEVAAAFGLAYAPPPPCSGIQLELFA